MKKLAFQMGFVSLGLALFFATSLHAATEQEIEIQKQLDEIKKELEISLGGTTTSSATATFSQGPLGCVNLLENIYSVQSDPRKEVFTLQQYLMNQGYDLGVPAPTGYFGPLTNAALAQFQIKQGISPSEGWLGPVTRGKIRDLTCGGGTSSTPVLIGPTKTGSVSVTLTANEDRGVVSLDKGDAVRLEWESDGATHCALGAPFNQGVSIEDAERLSSGSAYYPTSSGTKYSIICLGADGIATDEVLVAFTGTAVANSQTPLPPIPKPAPIPESKSCSALTSDGKVALGEVEASVTRIIPSGWSYESGKAGRVVTIGRGTVDSFPNIPTKYSRMSGGTTEKGEPGTYLFTDNTIRLADGSIVRDLKAEGNKPLRLDGGKTSDDVMRNTDGTPLAMGKENVLSEAGIPNQYAEAVYAKGYSPFSFKGYCSALTVRYPLSTNQTGSDTGATNPTSPSIKFAIGDEVYATSNLNVRATANGALIKTVPLNSEGKVIGGPQSAGGMWWWNVDFGQQGSGWSVQNYLQKGSAPVVIPGSLRIGASFGQASATVTGHGPSSMPIITAAQFGHDKTKQGSPILVTFDKELNTVGFRVLYEAPNESYAVGSNNILLSSRAIRIEFFSADGSLLSTQALGSTGNGNDLGVTFEGNLPQGHLRVTDSIKSAKIYIPQDYNSAVLFMAGVE